MMKLIAIGNRLMKDDGIAVAAAENLKMKLEDMGIEVIIGETDSQFCFHLLNTDDFAIILDAVPAAGNPGSIHVYELSEAASLYKKPGSQHEMSIFDFIGLYSGPLKGYLIGIEIAQTGLGFELSEVLKEKFNDICIDVERAIIKISRRA